MIPPTYSPPLTLDSTVILLAHERSASFPMPFLPINGRLPGDALAPAFLLLYPTFVVFNETLSWFS